MEENSCSDAIANYVMIVKECILVPLSNKYPESRESFTGQMKRLNQIVLYPQKFRLRNFFDWYAVNYVWNISLNRASIMFLYYCQKCRMSMKSFDD